MKYTYHKNIVDNVNSADKYKKKIYPLKTIN